MENLDKLLNSEKYISYNEYKEICEENSIELKEETLDNINSKFIENKLIV